MSSERCDAVFLLHTPAPTPYSAVFLLHAPVPTPIKIDCGLVRCGLVGCVGEAYTPTQTHFKNLKTLAIRVRLVHCNGYYTVIGINITRNKRSCNVITITIHLFGDNTWIKPYSIICCKMVVYSDIKVGAYALVPHWKDTKPWKCL